MWEVYFQSPANTNGTKTGDYVGTVSGRTASDAVESARYNFGHLYAHTRGYFIVHQGKCIA